MPSNLDIFLFIHHFSSILIVDFAANGAGATQFVFGKTSQQWCLQEDRVQHRFNPAWVVCAPPRSSATAGGVGAQVMAADYVQANTQHWIVEYW